MRVWEVQWLATKELRVDKFIKSVITAGGAL